MSGSYPIQAPAEAQRADADLLASHQPHGAKPDRQWRARTLKDGSRSGRNLITAA